MVESVNKEKVSNLIAGKEQEMRRLKGNSRRIRGLVFAVIVAVLSSVCFGYSGGSGTTLDPYEIADINDLLELTGDVNNYNKCFILTADINMGGQVFTTAIIAADTNNNSWGFQGTVFRGTFDGNGHKITNFTINGMQFLGLFGCVGVGGSVNNLGIEDCNVSGSEYIGGLIGYFGGNINECTSYARVSGDSLVGGLIGAIGFIPIGPPLTVTNSYATGEVDGNDGVGGLVGVQSDGLICNCYSAGKVTGGDANVGGLIGELYDGSIINSYWDVNSSGQVTSDGGEGKTTEDMQTANTFTGWGCYSAWTIDEGNDYPRLAWEGKSGVPITNSSYWAGNGTEVSPYLIYTPEQLSTIGLVPCSWDKHFKLMSDIDLGNLTPYEFNIIGFEGPYAFVGIFDGDNHTIINFSLTSYRSTNYAGLFGRIDGQEATIKNLQLIDPNIHSISTNWSGALVGWVENGNIINCSIEGGSISATRGEGIVSIPSTGGLVGTNHEGVISKCYATVMVTSKWPSVGGLVGENDGGDILNCYSGGNVSGDSYYIGGLVGENTHSGSISKCYSRGSVSGTGSFVGGLLGSKTSGAVIGSFWDVDSSGQSSSDGGTGKTTEEMQTMSTFTDAGWDFVGEVINGPNDIWRMCIDGVEYPKLWWEFTTGDFVCPDGVEFVDFAVLANTWLLEDGDAEYNPVCDIGVPADEIIDELDLAVFVNNWLEG